MNNNRMQKSELKMVKEHYVRRSLATIRPQMPYFFPIYLIILQMTFLVLFAIFGAYETEQTFNQQALNNNVSSFLNVHIMITLGFAFVMAFLKKFGYGSIGFTLLLVAYTLQWSLLVEWIFKQTLDATFTNWILVVNPLNLLAADYCVVAVLVSFGALVGKISLAQVITMATIEVITQCFNEYICTYFLMIHDVGHSMLTLTFGVFFGISVSVIMHFKRIESSKESSTYISSILSLLGTLVLWLYWPQFNSARATQGLGQSIAAMNTFLAMMGSCTATFFISALLNKGKLNPVHVRNATLAGGVVIGSVADLPIQPSGALVIGIAGGIISTVCYQYVTDFLKRKFINDTCGIMSLFGIPSIISGIISGIVAAILSENHLDQTRLFQVYPARNASTFNNTVISNITALLTSMNQTELTGRSSIQQGGYQILALGHTICVAVLFGIITDFVHDSEEQDLMFDDEIQWICPDDYSLHMNKFEVYTEEDEELIGQQQIQTTEFTQSQSQRGSRSRQ